MTETQLITACKKQDARAQQTLYERYSPVMLGVCRRYHGSLEEAEDVMVEGFFKIFTKIDTFSGEGSFEGWMRRVMVNESLMHLRKNRAFRFTEELHAVHDTGEEPTILEQLSAQEILGLLDGLPPGCRAVFNLYVIEGYKHREIADELQISINTSKSQLALAKMRLEELINKRLGTFEQRRT